MVARLEETYKNEIRKALQDQFKFQNPMQIPKLQKVVVNIGLSEAVADSKVVKAAAEELAMITGQRPVITKARKSIAGFKLREGMPIGVKVTLRGKRMYEFIDRLVNIAMPRIRDFRGISPKSFDGRGNYNMGLKEQLIFPEISYDKVDSVRGMDISISTSANNNEEALALLKGFNFPFAGKKQ